MSFLLECHLLGSPLYIFCMQRGGGTKTRTNGEGVSKLAEILCTCILNGWSQI